MIPYPMGPVLSSFLPRIGCCRPKETKRKPCTIRDSRLRRALEANSLNLTASNGPCPPRFNRLSISKTRRATLREHSRSSQGPDHLETATPASEPGDPTAPAFVRPAFRRQNPREELTAIVPLDRTRSTAHINDLDQFARVRLPIGSASARRRRALGIATSSKKSRTVRAKARGCS